jgi:chromosome segregation ATPase
VFGDSLRFFGPPNIGTHRVSAEKTAHDATTEEVEEERSPKTDREEHHHDEDNRISHKPEPSNIINQERRAKLEALQKARSEKAAHTVEQLAEQDAHENNDDDDEVVDKELERVQQKIQQLQKEKEKFANQLQAKRKASEKLEKLNQAREQIEIIQREIKEMQEQDNSSLWQDSPYQNSGQYTGPRKKMSSRVMESHNSWILNHHSP